nr:hypothetical protein [uncultured Clostridium sp.]
MFEKILYKMVIISPYILLALSFISLILGIVKKSLKEPCKKYFIVSVVSIILGIIIFFIPMIVIILNTMG